MSTFKLGSLLVRTLAKPVANSIKGATKQSPLFRKICIGVAQTIHRTEINIKMTFLGYKKETIRPLNDAKAIEAGATFFGEAFIFSVAGGIILFESLRTRNAAKDRREFVNDELDRLTEQSQLLIEETQEWRERVAGLERTVSHMAKVQENLLSAMQDATLSKALDVFSQAPPTPAPTPIPRETPPPSPSSTEAIPTPTSTLSGRSWWRFW